MGDFRGMMEKPIDSLIPYERNAKKHPEEQVEHIANSIKMAGFVQPVVIDRDNVVVIGHGRLLGAKKAGLKTVPCIMVDDLTPAQVKALRLADNKLNESPWDEDLLNLELDDIGLDIDMADFGFDILLDDEEGHVEIEEDAYEEKDVEQRCKKDDIWELGQHRLICGDSCNPETAKRLMGGGMAKILFTSPPYSDMRDYNGGKDLSVENIAHFIGTFRPYTDYQCVNLGIQRKDHEINPYWDEYIRQAREAGYKLMAWNVWDKGECGSIGQQSAFIPIRHEWIFVFGTEFYEINLTQRKRSEPKKNKDSTTRRQKDGSLKKSTKGDESKEYKQMESVLCLTPVKNKKDVEHPAPFPVELPGEYIQAMTKRGDAVIEPFGGSGSTVIACEQLGRKCFASELDEHYCDLIIDRWENLTGKEARLLERQ